jgi:hypothetical protein
MDKAQLKTKLISINKAIQLTCDGLSQEEIESNYAFEVLADAHSTLLDLIKESELEA